MFNFLIQYVTNNLIIKGILENLIYNCKVTIKKKDLKQLGFEIEISINTAITVRILYPKFISSILLKSAIYAVAQYLSHSTVLIAVFNQAIIKLGAGELYKRVGKIPWSYITM